MGWAKAQKTPKYEPAYLRLKSLTARLIMVLRCKINVLNIIYVRSFHKYLTWIKSSKKQLTPLEFMVYSFMPILPIIWLNLAILFWGNCLLH